jgi:murein DD-endopeptidase MepM/ murein hydrolase activator NlpD
LTHHSGSLSNASRRRIGPVIFTVVLVVAAVLGIFQFRTLNRRLQEEASRPLPVPPPVVVPEVVRQDDGVFEPNQTITEVLTAHGVSAALAQRIVDCARPDYNLAMVKADNPFHIRFGIEDQFRNFEYTIDSDRYLIVSYDEGKDSLISSVKPFPYETRVEKVSAVIESSVFGALMDIGEKDLLALDLEDIFNSDIDFYIDIRKGDSFTVLVEKKYLDGQFAKYGAIQAALFQNDGRKFLGYRFEDKNGKPAYFDPDGKSLKKSFLKSPLKFTRISSRFSLARRNPVTKKVQPHLGVDYAAPMGTPVRAVGSGRVLFAGKKGLDGNMIHLRHPKGYETLYLHLSKCLVKTGASVSQGQVIGYVGSTGRSTGPHLDFRIRRNGKALNPLKIIFPPGDPVPPEKFEAFAAVRDKWKHQLNSE